VIPEIAQAIGKSKLARVYVANIMTQPGETSGMLSPTIYARFQRHTSRR